MSKKLTNNQLLLTEAIKHEFINNGSYSNESEFFEFFATAQILKNYNLSDDEICSGIVGNGGDGGCDGIYTFLNDNLLFQDQLDKLTFNKGARLDLFIIQAKREFSFKEDAIMKWKTISENLLQLSNSVESFTQRYNEDVLNSFILFRDVFTKLVRSQVKLNIKFIYVSLASELHINVSQQATELQNNVKKMFPAATVNIDFIDSDKLMELFSTLSEIILSLPLVEQPISLGKKQDYVCLVTLEEYYKFIVDEKQNLRNQIFEANVRDYQGHNAVNSAIQETLVSDSIEDFWWLNNGITILSDSAALVTTREIQLTNPEIVNGLQTSNEIFTYFSSGAKNIEKESRNLLLRIIVPETDESRDRIIFATNNQTNISKSSLRVTDPIHHQIEMYLKTRGLYYDRRKNYYKNQGIKTSNIISVSFLGQCMISIFLKMQDYARARPSTLLTNDNYYEQLYKEGTNLNIYYKCAWIGKRIKDYIKSLSEYTSAEKNDILFYVIYGVAFCIVKKDKIEFSDMELLDLNTITDDIISNCVKQIYNRYKELGGNSTIAKSSNFKKEVDQILSSC